MPPAWYASPFTGLFRRCGPLPTRAHDPEVCVWSATLPRWGPDGADLTTGGAGWDEAAAEAAAVGEAVERCRPQPLPLDETVTAAFADWPLDEPAVAPDRWLLFHAEQHAQPSFPFAPFTANTPTRWVRCRRLIDGEPCWTPEELVFLQPRPGEPHRLAPGLSTGLSCGRVGGPVLLRGLQEVVERDALVGAWLGVYPLEEHDADRVLDALGDARARRLRRPNLRYRCYRVRTPFSDHVTLVTLTGPDREGHCFSVGSACRETRLASWEKAFLEAVQGRFYVRWLKRQGVGTEARPPCDFAEHAVFYSWRPDLLRRTVLEGAQRPQGAADAGGAEPLPALLERLGPERPALFRLLTPPGLSGAGLDWVVARVLVPGLRPLHGHHQLPFLGGPSAAPGALAAWRATPPHPFP